MIKEEIFDSLEYEKRYFDLKGVEITDEDVNYTLSLMHNGMDFEDAIHTCLHGIYMCLN